MPKHKCHLIPVSFGDIHLTYRSVLTRTVTSPPPYQYFHSYKWWFWLNELSSGQVDEKASNGMRCRHWARAKEKGRKIPTPYTLARLARLGLTMPHSCARIKIFHAHACGSKIEKTEILFCLSRFLIICVLFSLFRTIFFRSASAKYWIFQENHTASLFHELHGQFKELLSLLTYPRITLSTCRGHFDCQ